MSYYVPNFGATVNPILNSASEQANLSASNANRSAGGLLGWLGNIGRDWRQRLWDSPLGQRTMLGMRAAGLNPVGLNEPSFGPVTNVNHGVAKPNPAVYEGTAPLQRAPEKVGRNVAMRGLDPLAVLRYSTRGLPIYDRQAVQNARNAGTLVTRGAFGYVR